MFHLYRIRHLLSWFPALALLVTLWQVSKQAPLKIQPHYEETTMELALVEPAAEPSPSVEPPPEPQTPPEPQPEPVAEPPPPPEAPPVPAEIPQPPPPVRKPEPRKPEPAKRAPEKKTPAVKKAAPAKQAAPAPQAVKKAPVEPVTRPVANNAGQENSYQSGLRGLLEQTKRYPTGRQAALERPKGDVEVWLEVDRSGRVLASGIGKRATNMLLNRAALTSLKSLTQVKPFPAEAYAGQNSKRFSATFSYRAP